MTTVDVTAHSEVTDFELGQAILIYRARLDTYGGPKAAYASIHEVDKTQAGFHILPGTPVTVEGLKAALALLVPQEAQKPVLLDGHVLSQGSHHLVWWRPPQEQQVWFNSEKLGARTNKVGMPSLVFMVSNRNWWVYAIKGDQRPNADTPLFLAPFFNVYDDGAVCTGNVALPKGKDFHKGEAWEKSFFRSYFTHPNVHEPKGLTLRQGGPFKLWQDMLDRKIKRIPEASLVPTKMTLGNAFERNVAKGA